jgi:hypothetical protein
VAAAVLEVWKELTKNDVKSTSMGASGVDVQLSEAAIKVWPYAVECKFLARQAVYQHFEQARSNTPEGMETLVVLKQNHSDPLAVITLKHFMELTGPK